MGDNTYAFKISISEAEMDQSHILYKMNLYYHHYVNMNISGIFQIKATKVKRTSLGLSYATEISNS